MIIFWQIFKKGNVWPKKKIQNILSKMVKFCSQKKILNMGIWKYSPLLYKEIFNANDLLELV
jgi:hypothetical protein